MKVVIFCGGLGTRLSEETKLVPKPMVEIGGEPILIHIMRYYASYGYNDFILCAGYKQHIIKDYFLNKRSRQNDYCIDLSTGQVEEYEKDNIDWKVTVINTGELTMTGGRLAQVIDYIDEENFLLTYGDGLIDMDLNNTLEVHRANNATVTLTATLPSGRFGALEFSDDRILAFKEKPRGDGAYINGGYFVVNKEKIKKYLGGENCVWETDVLAHVAEQGELFSYKYNGFWEPMDTLRDKEKLEMLLAKGNAPWTRKKI